VLQAIENIKETAHWEVDVELDLFHAKSGANCWERQGTTKNAR